MTVRVVDFFESFECYGYYAIKELGKPGVTLCVDTSDNLVERFGSRIVCGIYASEGVIFLICM